jgi:Flagellin and related hook-associated proteins
MVTQGALYSVTRAMSKSLEKLSTGLRINTAADDAAGLGVSENLRTQVTGLQQASKNTQDAISLLNIADGALNEQANILQRMRELCIQAMNDTYTSTERGYMGQEFISLRDELDRIAASTNFNKMQIFAAPDTTDGVPTYPGGTVSDTASAPRKTALESNIDPGNMLFSADDKTSGNHFNMFVGANYTTADAAAFNNTNHYDYFTKDAPDMITIQFGQMDTNGLLNLDPGFVRAKDLFADFSWDPVNNVNDDNIAWGAVTSGEYANDTDATVNCKLRLLLNLIDGSDNVNANYQQQVWNLPGTGETYVTGLKRVNEMRAKIGAMTNRLEHSVSNDNNQINNQQAAESQIRDVDFAKETSTYTKNQILTNSATAMLAQANSAASRVLSLLR